jgi:hypothetical protein
VLPKYPIYIPSLGRWDSRATARALELMRVPYHICVEPSEYDNYAAVIDPIRILKLPEDFHLRGQGSIPVRNWIWDHAVASGAARHWIIDDNIFRFWRLYRGRLIEVGDGTIFRCAEDFSDRYENVALSGFNYDFYPGSRRSAYTLNTRVYSIILVNNAVPYRWRGRYNEDTDLSLRALKGGWCTVLFNAFLARKPNTMTMKGGNTDTIYATASDEQELRLEFAERLYFQHPDVVRVVEKWGRWHHQVDYAPFKNNKLKLRPGVVRRNGVDEYGMRLGDWRQG